MSGLLPKLHNTALCQFPITRQINFLSDVAQAINATEQRARVRPPLTTITLPFNRVPAADFANFQSFFDSQRGPYTNDWGVVVGKWALVGDISGTTFTCSLGNFTEGDVGADVVKPDGTRVAGINAFVDPGTVTLDASVSYSGEIRWGYYIHHLTLEAMTFEATEQDQLPNLYNFTIQARQTQNKGFITGSPGGTFPTFSFGSVAELPYVQIRRYQVMQNNNPMGPNYSWTWFNGSLSGFPNDPQLPGWQIDFGLLTDVDLRVLESFFYSQYGIYGTFTFPNPHGGSPYSHCRFDSNTLTVRHYGFNHNSASVRIRQVAV